MKIDCIHCGAEFDASDDAVRCPRCEQVVVVDAEVVDAEIIEEDEPQARPKKAPVKSSTHVVCPMCDEQNLKTAKKCRYCGERLSPDGQTGVWRDGKILVMSKEAELPYRCVKTNEPAETLLRRKLSWHSPVIFVSLVAGLLIYVILAVVLSKKADIQVPLSLRIKKRRSTAIIAGWLCALGSLGVTILVCMLLAESQNPMWRDAIPFIIIGGIVLVVLSAVISAMISSVVTPTKITDTHVWLKGVHSDYLDLLPEWPGE